MKPLQPIIPMSIFLHHSLTRDDEIVNWTGVRRWHMGLISSSPYKMRDIGYHFGIEKIKSRHEILIGRMMKDQGAHVRGWNRDSLGILFIGNFDKKPPPEEQWKLGLNLVSTLCSVFLIPLNNVYGHREFDPNKTCPGTAFDLNLFRSQLVN